MSTFEAIQQLAKDIQSILADACSCPVHEREPLRTEDGTLANLPPYIVYSVSLQSALSESGQMLADVFIDAWGYATWADCYTHAAEVDAVMDGVTHSMESGTLFCDRNGIIMDRQERDPDDERIRRMASQYVIRYYPQLG